MLVNPAGTVQVLDPTVVKLTTVRPSLVLLVVGPTGNPKNPVSLITVFFNVVVIFYPITLESI
jgi:hypothetical protein